MPKLTLRGWLVSAVALLAALNVAWRIYAGWGLVTLKADKRPLREVITAIERQGHVTLKTNLDPATPVTLRLERMTVPDSLERLAAVTDARWRLTYAVARNQGAARGAFANWVAAAGNAPAPDGWKWFDHQLPFGADLLGGDDNNAAEPGIGTPDPRQDMWRVTTPTANGDNAPPPNTLQAFLDLGSNILDVAFLAPADWNPAVAKGPNPGALSRVVPNLASAAGGRAEEAFLLMKNGRRGPRPGAADNNAQAGPPPDGAPGDNGPRRGGRGNGGPGGDRGRGLAERMQARIDNLPPDQRAAAQARLNAEREFWQNLRNLPPEERRAAMEARMNDPATQDRMMDRGAARDSLSTPQQRIDRYRRYVERREQIKNR